MFAPQEHSVPCCLTYQNAENLGKSGPLYFLLGFILPCIPILLLRKEAREKYDIEVKNELVPKIHIGTGTRDLP